MRSSWSTAGSQTVPGTEFELECELVLLAMGFVGPERNALLDGLGVELTERGTVAPRRRLRHQRRRACSWPVTWAAARA